MKRPHTLQVQFFFILIFIVFSGCVLPDIVGPTNPVAGDPPTADFSVDQSVILPTQTVQFTDLSTGDPAGWSWEFGDGGTSLLQNPTHQYDDFGSFDVTLTVTNPDGSDEYTIQNCVTVRVEIGPEGSVTDRDGNTYKTIKIGHQWWMAENLRVTGYESGGNITYIGNNEDWLDLDINQKAMGYYDFNVANATAKGALYTHPAATNGVKSTMDSNVRIQGVCPSGWHLPSDTEWQALEINLGMSALQATFSFVVRGTNQGSKMAGNANQWNAGALTNDPEFGVSKLKIGPYGYMSASGTPLFLGEAVSYWSSNTHGSAGTDSDNAWARRLLYDHTGVFREFSKRTNGMYVRCVMD